MKKVIVFLLLALVLLTGCRKTDLSFATMQSGETEPAGTIQAEESHPPETAAPETEPPETDPPETQPTVPPTQPTVPSTPPTQPAPPSTEAPSPAELDCQAAADYGNAYALQKYGGIGWKVDPSLNEDNAGFFPGTTLPAGATQAALNAAAAELMDYIYDTAMMYDGAAVNFRVNCVVYTEAAYGQLWYVVQVFYG